MADLFSMKNRVVLLTGASRGLGRDMALALAGAGATVLCAGRTVKELDQTARAITRKGGKAHVVPLDITDEADVVAKVRAIISKHRRIDALVNNAGDHPSPGHRRHRDAGFSQGDRDQPDLAVRRLPRGRPPHAGAQVRQDRQHLLGPGVVGRASVAGYVSAKHGLIGLTKNLAAELGPHVTANAIAPGYIRTELNVPLQQNKDFNAMLESRTAVARWGKPEDLRGALLLLASDAGSYITGHTLVIDGGLPILY